MSHYFFSEEFEKKKSRFYEIITHAFTGIISVIDKDGTILYTQNLSGSSGNSGKDWIDKKLSHFLENGFLSATPSLKALQSGKTEVSFIFKKNDYSIVTVATPVFDEHNNIENVVAYSLPEESISGFSKIILEERNKTTQLVNYLFNYSKENTFYVSQNPAINNVFKTLSKVAYSDANIMITGETGSGKEVFSRYVHVKSNRSNQVFVPVNCSAIPEELMESEFFGYEKGAFTGASKEGKVGLFELANHGTLFLDEIGEMPLSMQPKLLRILENKEYRKVGGTSTHKVDVRVICATNKNLLQMVKEGKFREDLYYRLNVIPVTIPPLRDRVEDIVPMATLFLDNLNKKYNTSKMFSKNTIKYLEQYNWPGNVRELSNTVEKLYFTADSDFLDILADTTTVIKNAVSINRAEELEELDISLPLKEKMRQYEKKYIDAVLKSCNGKVSLAAEKLQITKAGLYKKLDSYKNGATSQD